MLSTLTIFTTSCGQTKPFIRVTSSQSIVRLPLQMAMYTSQRSRALWRCMAFRHVALAGAMWLPL